MHKQTDTEYIIIGGYFWQNFDYTFFFVLAITVSVLDNENKLFFKNKLIKLFFQEEGKKVIDIAG